MAWLGSAGLGLVWGWLLGTKSGRRHRPWLTILALLAATGLVAGETWLLVGPQPAPIFLGAVIAGALLQLAWRRALRARLTTTEQG